MIQNVSKIQSNNLKINPRNCDSVNNFAGKSGKLNQDSYSFNNSNKVNFKGGLVKAKTVDLFVERQGKTRRFIGEALETIGGALRKLKGNNELPISKTPKIAKSQFGDYPAYVIQKVIDWNRSHPNSTPIPVPSRNAPISVLDAALGETRTRHFIEPDVIDHRLLDDGTTFGSDHDQHIANSDINDHVTNIGNHADNTAEHLSEEVISGAVKVVGTTVKVIGHILGTIFG